MHILLQWLLHRGALVNQRAVTRGITALHVAAYANRKSALDLLLAAGADVAAADTNGHTALHVAALLDNSDVVPPLLTAGADPRARDAKGRTPEDLAHAKDSQEVLKLLAVLSFNEEPRKAGV